MKSTRLLFRLATGVLYAGIPALVSAPVFATNVTMNTPLGAIEIELFDEAAPKTVANFLKYVNDGDYQNSFIHRVVPEFVVQGGGFFYVDGVADLILTDPPVENEPGISNVRGTIAMAKQEGDPNSATSQWFFNLEDNSDQLDDSNGGFTVFGQVLGDGMDVVDEIADLRIWNAGSPFGELPLIDYPGTGPVLDTHVVLTDIQVSSDFLINPGLNDAWYNPATDGQGFLIIVYPVIEQMFISWFTFDTGRPDDSVSANLGEPGHRWLTAQGPYSGNTGNLDVYVTAGGVFDAGTPAPSSSQDGTMVVEFTGCNSGTVSYDIPSIDQQGVVPIQRVVSDNVLLCDELAAPAAE